MIKLNQAFYGRDPIRGYRLLASSDNRFNQIVERLCSAIGSPDGISSIEPFYINYIENDYRYMISCCIGNPDDSGRKTLFFHAFIGQHRDMQNKHFGIGSLIHQKAFLPEYNPGPVLSKDFEEDMFSIPWGETPLRNELPLAIQSPKPDLSIIAGILKGRINDVSWASFTFQPLNEFQVYIISQFVAFPRDRKCVSVSGELVSLPKQKKDNPPIQTCNPSMQTKSNSTTFTRLSVALNIVLLFACIVLLVHRTASSSSQIEPEVTNQISDINEQKQTNADLDLIPSATESIEESEPKIIQSQLPIVSVSRESVIEDLRDEFVNLYNNPHVSIEDYRKETINNSRLVRMPEEEKQILRNAEQYINFINKTFFGESEEN